MEPIPSDTGQGWPRRNRLRSREEIRVLFTRGQARVARAGSVFLLFRVVPFSECAFKIGFAVRRRVKAVERNRAKRLMKETVRRHQALLRPPTGTLTCMVVYRGPVPIDGPRLQANVQAALRRMHDRISD